jgi:hypothetical protein
MRDTRHSQNGAGQTARSKLHGYLLASAVVLAGCSSTTAPIDDQTNVTRPVAAASFKVSLSVTEMDESVCRIEVTATTRGGDDGAYGVWQQLRARAYDAKTGEFIGNARTQQLHPDVFDTDRINAGQTQWGMLNLELFRREAGDQVVVELEFYYSAVENGGYQDRMAKTTHSCR